MSIVGVGLLLLQVQLAAASGMVTKPGGSEPLPKATIILTPVTTGQTARMRSGVTEEDGRFTVRDIEPGEYRLLVQTERYGNATYGQRKPGGPGTILTITAGQQLSDLRISMIPTGTIAGRITGRNGEPLVYATVQALKYAYRDGQKALTIAQIATTDDRGEYRLFWLPPGSYFVAAAKAQTIAGLPSGAEPLRPGMSASSPITDSLAVAQAFQLLDLLQGEAFLSANTTARILEDGTVQEEAWAPVYYPTAAEPRLATAIDLAAGTIRSGIDIIVGPSRVQKVRGRVVGFAPGSTPSVTLVPLNTVGFRNPTSGKGASSIDGTFGFTGVLPGDYVVVARDMRAGALGPPLPIHVGEGDVENLTVSVGQPLSLSGRILLEGGATDSRSPNPLAAVYVSLRPSNLPLPVLAPFNAQVDVSTGSFVVNNLVPGDYLIQVNTTASPAADKPLYVKSARLGLTDVTGNMSISANTADRLDIVLTADPGLAEGVAIGSSGGPAANATVVLVPNLARKRSDLYKSVVTGTDGRFRFQDLAPGDYTLFAWDDIETGAWQDPDFMRAYESKGLLVHITEKGKEDVQLNVIYNP